MLEAFLTHGAFIRRFTCHPPSTRMQHKTNELLEITSQHKQNFFYLETGQTVHGYSTISQARFLKGPCPYETMRHCWRGLYGPDTLTNITIKAYCHL